MYLEPTRPCFAWKKDLVLEGIKANKNRGKNRFRVVISRPASHPPGPKLSDLQEIQQQFPEEAAARKGDKLLG